MVSKIEEQIEIMEEKRKGSNDKVEWVNGEKSKLGRRNSGVSGREGETVKQTDGLQHYRPRKEDK